MFFGIFPPNWAPKIYPFPRKIGNAHAVQMTTWVGGGGGGETPHHESALNLLDPTKQLFLKHALLRHWNWK